MKKLESLNSPKYSLTPEKMGKLVGGAITHICTGGGYTNSGKKYSSDYCTRYSDKDVKNNIVEKNEVYYGANDEAKRDAAHCNCK